MGSGGVPPPNRGRWPERGAGRSREAPRSSGRPHLLLGHPSLETCWPVHVASMNNNNPSSPSAAAPQRPQAMPRTTLLLALAALLAAATAAEARVLASSKLRQPRWSTYNTLTGRYQPAGGDDDYTYCERPGTGHLGHLPSSELRRLVLRPPTCALAPPRTARRPLCNHAGHRQRRCRGQRLWDPLPAGRQLLCGCQGLQDGRGGGPRGRLHHHHRRGRGGRPRRHAHALQVREGRLGLGQGQGLGQERGGGRGAPGMPCVGALSGPAAPRKCRTQPNPIPRLRANSPPLRCAASCWSWAPRRTTPSRCPVVRSVEQAGRMALTGAGLGGV